MYRTIKLLIAALAVMGLAAGCAQKAAKNEGFLSDYADLKKVDDDFSFYKAPDMTVKNYPRMMFEPIQFDLAPGDLADFSAEQQQEIREYAQKAATKVIASVFTIVQQPGPGTGRIRMAFTDIEKSNALLALYPMTRAAGVGRGGAAIQGEVLDSETGSQLAAWTRAGKGSALHGSGVGDLSDIETAIDTWQKAAMEGIVKQLK